MDTEKPEKSADQPKQDIGELVGDLVVSGATVLAHTAAKAVVKRVNSRKRRDFILLQIVDEGIQITRIGDEQVHGSAFQGGQRVGGQCVNVVER